MSKFKLVADHACADDWAHDAWGTAMGIFFDIAAVLDASDIEGDITPPLFTVWDYHRGASAVPSLETLAAEEGDSFGAQSLAQAVIDGDIVQADLAYAGNVLHRYTELLRAAGRDY